MLKVLVKKQMLELNQSFFYNRKKGEVRSTAGKVASIGAYVLLMVGVVGGMFAFFSLSVCSQMVSAGADWLYFAVFGMMAIALGVFGSVFNTYSGLYKAKDNDLLFSMPIPVKDILASRLIGVYLMGLMFSAVITAPATIVYWIVGSFSIASVFGGIVLTLVTSVIVLVLSCILGWVIAKISNKLKHKSIITVIVSLVFLGTYYVICFRSSELLQSLATNALLYGEKIKGSAYPLYLFGKIGEGDAAAIAAWLAVSLVILAAAFYVLGKTFLKLATATGAVAKHEYKQKRIARKSVQAALFGKELARFTASPNYMLNCGLGTIIMPIAAVVVLIKGGDFMPMLEAFFVDTPAAIPVIFCAAACMAVSMNDITAPSVSLEGKNIWIAQSLPVSTWQVLKAKLNLQLAATLVPAAVLSCSMAAIIDGNLAGKVFVAAFPLLYTFMSACFGLYINLKKPNLTWTNEIIPIKQSMSVTVALFGGWAYTVAFGALYFFVGYKLGGNVFFAVVSIATIAIALVLYRWLRTKGAKAFAEL